MDCPNQITKEKARELLKYCKNGKEFKEVLQTYWGLSPIRAVQTTGENIIDYAERLFSGDNRVVVGIAG